MSLQGAIEWIQDQALTLSGVGEAPDNPNEVSSHTNKIWVITYPNAGTIKSASAGWGYDLDEITIQIRTWRNDLSEAMQRLEGYPHALVRLIQADPTMSGNVATYGDSITYSFIQTTWNDVEVIGYDVILSNVKALTTF